MIADFKIHTMAEMAAAGEHPEVLFWVGCAGSFDDRSKKVTKAVAKILFHTGIKFAVLGTEESCTGDPAKRSGNEFLFQMQAMNNIAVLNGYNIISASWSRTCGNPGSPIIRLPVSYCSPSSGCCRAIISQYLRI